MFFHKTLASNLKTVSSSPLFQSLRSSVDQETRNFNFACGGTIPIVAELPKNRVGSYVPGTSPRIPRESCRPGEPSSDAELPTRSNLCLPVEIRWDAKDNSALSSRTKVTFNAYEVGIVDTIAQALLPSLGHSQRTSFTRPLGKFDSHVDTPRSPDQFGSLVVCLPLAHQGGALEVRHKGKTVLFDWGSQTDVAHPSIKWAAFCSDCEHRVLEVTEGHRLALTYNLYVVRGNGFLGGDSPALDPVTLPLYRKIRDLVQDKSLWSDGGYIGYHCVHVYPHTASSKFHFVAPDNLKGADMAIHSICNSLGLAISFRPALIQDASQSHNLYDYDENDDCIDVNCPILGADGKLDHFKIDSWDEGDDELKFWLGWVNDQEDEPAPRRYLQYGEIPWLNQFGHLEDHITYMAYGNNAELIFMYSCMVMVIQVPRLGQASS